MVLPQRVVLCVFGFLAVVNAYTMRHCWDLVLPQIATPQPNNLQQRSHFGDQPKPKVLKALSARLQLKHVNLTRLPVTRRPGGEHRVTPMTTDWSSGVQTAILVSFYAGYVASHIPGGMMAERYGGKWILGVCLALTAVFTIATPLVVKLGGPWILIFWRVLIGLSEGPIFPALSVILSRRVPPNERGTLGVFVLSGGQVGILLANLLTGLMLARFSWTLVFYFFGGCTFLWFIGFTLFCYDDPEDNPFIEEGERQYLQLVMGDRKAIDSEHLSSTPWKEIFTSVPMWALISATVQYDWTQSLMVSELRRFMESAKESGVIDNLLQSIEALVPFVINWILSLLSGLLSDVLVNHDILTTTEARKVMTFLAAFGPKIFASLTDCFRCSESRTHLLSRFSCALSVMGSYYAGAKLTPLDMSPNYAGTVMGIANGFGSLTAIIAPYVERFDEETVGTRKSLDPPLKDVLENLRSAVWLMCSMLISGEVQSFNDPVPRTEY